MACFPVGPLASVLRYPEGRHPERRIFRAKLGIALLIARLAIVSIDMSSALLTSPMVWGYVITFSAIFPDAMTNAP